MQLSSPQYYVFSICKASTTQIAASATLQENGLAGKPFGLQIFRARKMLFAPYASIHA
jgi:hypothetical protein